MTGSARVSRSSFHTMCARCVSTVRTEMNRRAAISWFVRPSASRCRMSRSRRPVRSRRPCDRGADAQAGRERLPRSDPLQRARAALAMARGDVRPTALNGCSGTARVWTCCPRARCSSRGTTALSACSRSPSTNAPRCTCTKPTSVPASSLIEEAAAIAEATGSRPPLYGAVVLATFRGLELESAELIEISTRDLVCRGEGEG
jgi:hypothetical protein